MLFNAHELACSSWTKFYLSLAEVMYAEGLTIISTGPLRDAAASVSADSFKKSLVCPGTHTRRMRRKCCSTDEQNSGRMADEFGGGRAEQTDKEWVMITTEEIDVGSFRRARMITNYYLCLKCWCKLGHSKRERPI